MRFNTLNAVILGLGLFACGDSKEINNNYGDCRYCEDNPSNSNSPYSGNPGNSSPESNPEEDLVERIIGSANLSQAPANSQAEVSFENLTVLLEADGEPIERAALARVYYFAGSEFQCFLAEHPDYTHAIECFDASSYKDSESEDVRRLSLTPAPLQGLYFGANNRAAAAYYDWLSENSVFENCYTKERIGVFTEIGIYFVSWLNSFLSLGSAWDTLEEALDEYSDDILEQWPEDAVTDIKVFTPSRYGFPGTTSIWSVELRARRNGERCVGDEVSNGNNDGNYCDLPSCIRYDAANCEEPCFYTESRCAIPCEDDNDCPSGEFNLRCISVPNGRACLLPSCSSNEDCYESEECIDVRNYSFNPTPSGAWPLATREGGYLTCYPGVCIPPE